MDEKHPPVGADMAESGEWSRTIACEDHAGRERHLELFLTEKGDLALRVPAGEVAVIKPAQIAEVRQAINDGQIESMARRPGP